MKLLKKCVNIVYVIDLEKFMKKHGFTLAEILITLGIIAIAAASLAPIYLKAKPDKYKFKLINCYNKLNDATERLVTNPYIYDIDNLCQDKAILHCDNQVQDTDGAGVTYTGTGAECKYPELIAQLLHLEGSNCNSGNYKGTENDHTIWEFEYDSNSGYIVTLTFPRTGEDCGPYNAATCKSPNRFKLLVSFSGDVYAHDDDKLAKIFISNMDNIHKQDDYSQLLQE